MPPSTKSVQDSRPKSRKRAQDKIPRKRIRVSEMAGPSTSFQDRMRTIKRMKMKMTEEGEGLSPPAKRKKKGHLEQVLTKEPPSSVDINTAKFQKKYIELHQLGEGGFGSVFAGYRVEDKLPVAIKHIPKDNVVLKHRDENGRVMALEVAIMLKLRNLTTSSLGQSAMVSLLDWYDLNQELIVVMERPMPAEDLYVYLNERGGCLKEKEAKIILKQLVEAGICLQDANIFHRDIKVENILIETNSEIPRVCLIDFGLSCFDHRRKFCLYRGTCDHIPPEFYRHGNYSAGPTTVWQLGVVLFEILHKKMFKTTTFLKNKLKISKRLSKNCQDLLTKFLKKVPGERPNLEELLCHPWFS
ncbi:serine/threonine-protein kinase pim-2-like [Anableps anableps]